MSFKTIQYTNNQYARVRDLKYIQDKNDAYFIGYLAGDGNVLGIKNENRSTRMSVGSADEYIIKYFQERYQPDSKYSSRMGGSNPNKNIYATMMSHRITFSPFYSEMFDYYGILDYKPNREMKNIQEEYVKHFLLGLMDSDGSISYHYGDNGYGGNRFRCGVKYTHPSTKLLNSIKDYIKINLNVDCSINKKKNEDCYALSISGLNDCLYYLRWLYSDTPEICNLRKLEKGSNLKQEILKLKYATKEKVSGVKVKNLKTKTSYLPFITLSNKMTYLGVRDTYDDAVKARLIAEATNMDIISKNSLCNFNPLTNTFISMYNSLDDNRQTFIEVSLDGNILRFEKLGD